MNFVTQEEYPARLDPLAGRRHPDSRSESVTLAAAARDLPVKSGLGSARAAFGPGAGPAPSRRLQT